MIYNGLEVNLRMGLLVKLSYLPRCQMRSSDNDKACFIGLSYQSCDIIYVYLLYPTLMDTFYNWLHTLLVVRLLLKLLTGLGFVVSSATLPIILTQRYLILRRLQHVPSHKSCYQSFTLTQILGESQHGRQDPFTAVCSILLIPVRGSGFSSRYV